MRQRPFIFQNVIVDLQGRERIRRAVAECRANLAFHSENSGALHRCEIGENISVRLKIENGQLARRFLQRARECSRLPPQRLVRASPARKVRAAMPCL